MKRLNTLFGMIPLESPRFYSCNHCQKIPKSFSFSPLSQLIPIRSTPELLYIEAKYASLMSYGLTTQLLKDFLPIHTHLNAASIRNHTLKVAKCLDERLGNEQYFFAEGCPYPSRKAPSHRV